MDFDHTLSDACGCDLCDAARADLCAWHDERRAVFLDEADGGPLPWELAWAPATSEAA